jgi:hypothetical protein
MEICIVSITGHRNTATPSVLPGTRETTYVTHQNNIEVSALATDVAKHVAADPRIVRGYAGLRLHAATTTNHNTSSNELTSGARLATPTSHDCTTSAKIGAIVYATSSSSYRGH